MVVAMASAHSLLSSIADWPVDTVAAGLIVGVQVVDTVGDIDHVFELASVTKLLSAYGCLIAIEEGIMEVDTPLGPEGSTVRHLLAHASGLATDEPVPMKPVGERRIYSSAAFQLLADHVAAESGFGFGDYVREAVFAPLGMTHTEIYGPAGFAGRSTVGDLCRFVTEVITPKLVSQELLSQALSVQFSELAGIVPGYGRYNPCPWGLGFEIKGQKNPHWTGENQPADTVGHFGQAGTYVWIHPASRIGMVALTDRAFGEWAKPLWSHTNAQVWAGVTDTSGGVK